MADNDLNVLGVMRGKLGNVVGIGRGSVQLYRGYLAHIRNPRTAGQLLTRACCASVCGLFTVRGLDRTTHFPFQQ